MLQLQVILRSIKQLDSLSIIMVECHIIMKMLISHPNLRIQRKALL